jgi:hypothetical protein
MNKNRNISLLSDKDMNNVKGGGEWVYFPGVGYTYLLDEVTINNDFFHCQRCSDVCEANYAPGGEGASALVFGQYLTHLCFH